MYPATAAVRMVERTPIEKLSPHPKTARISRIHTEVGTLRDAGGPFFPVSDFDDSEIMRGPDVLSGLELTQIDNRVIRETAFPWVWNRVMLDTVIARQAPLVTKASRLIVVSCPFHSNRYE